MRETTSLGRESIPRVTPVFLAIERAGDAWALRVARQTWLL